MIDFPQEMLRTVFLELSGTQSVFWEGEPVENTPVLDGELDSNVELRWTKATSGSAEKSVTFDQGRQRNITTNIQRNTVTVSARVKSYSKQQSAYIANRIGLRLNRVGIAAALRSVDLSVANVEDAQTMTYYENGTSVYMTVLDIKMHWVATEIDPSNDGQWIETAEINEVVQPSAPLAISGCVACFVGGYMNQGVWFDSSPSGLIAVQPVPSRQPTVESSVATSTPSKMYPYFDGGDYLDTAGEIDLRAGYTVAIRVFLQETKDYNGYIAVDVDNGNGVGLQLTQFATVGFNWAHGAANNPVSYGGTDVTGHVTAGAWHTILWSCDGTEIGRLADIDGLSVNIFDNATMGADPFAMIDGPGTLRIGQGFDVGGDNKLRGRIKGLVIYDRALSAFEKMQVRNYLGGL
jgi:hypothetical protein